jgi:hypothetical protein
VGRYTVQAGNSLSMIDFCGVLMVQTGNLLPEIHVLCDVKHVVFYLVFANFYLLIVGVGVIFALGHTQ